MLVVHAGHGWFPWFIENKILLLQQRWLTAG
jgi:hypothetical protein